MTISKGHRTLLEAVVVAFGDRPKRVELEIGVTSDGEQTIDRRSWDEDCEVGENFVTLKRAARSLAALPVGPEVYAHVWVDGGPPRGSDDEYVTAYTVTKAPKGWIATE